MRDRPTGRAPALEAVPHRRPQTLVVLHQFIAGTLAVGVWSLVGAFVLRLAERAVTGRDEPFPYVVAFAITLYANLVNYSVAWGLVGLVLLTGSESATVAAAAVMVPVGLLVQAKVLSRRLDLAFGKAFMVSLITYSVTFLAGLLGLALLAALGEKATGQT
jgi:hypothetical protein